MNAEPLEDITVGTAHPLPLRRLVFHYKLGLPSLGRRPMARRSLAGAERLLARIIPASHWEHVVATARRPAGRSDPPNQERCRPPPMLRRVIASPTAGI